MIKSYRMIKQQAAAQARDDEEEEEDGDATMAMATSPSGKGKGKAEVRVSTYLHMCSSEPFFVEERRVVYFAMTQSLDCAGSWKEGG